MPHALDARRPAEPAPAATPSTPAIGPARDEDAAAISALNNRFAPDGLTLPRTPAFVAARLESYRVARDRSGRVVGCVALDEYAPSLVELVSLAVAPEAQGQGLGRRLITAAEALARSRGYDELFAVSLADALFLAMGFTESSIARYPEKAARYAAISRSELSIGRKFLFVKRLDAPPPAAKERRRRTRGAGASHAAPAAGGAPTQG